MRLNNNQNGFSLIELIITLAIIAILAGIAYPVYTSHIVKVRRTHAAVALTNMAAYMEQYYNEHHTYEGATPHSSNPYYKLVITGADEDDYILKAIPLGAQAQKDTTCGTLILDSVGKKSITGSGTVQQCW